MKKCFICETGREIKFGDIVKLNLTKNLKDGSTVHKVIKCKFHPILIEPLLEQGIIELRDVEDEEKLDDENQEVEEFFEELLKRYSELEERVIELEGIVAELTEKPNKNERKN